MIRSVVSVIVGFVVASAVMMSFEFANARVFYPGFAELARVKDREASEEARKRAPNDLPDEPAVLMRRREAVREVMAGAPVGALLVVVLGYTLGGLAGGYVAAWLSKKSSVRHGIVLGGLLTLAGIANNLMIPPPAWFWIATLIVFVPSACVGAKFAARPSEVP